MMSQISQIIYLDMTNIFNDKENNGWTRKNLEKVLEKL